MRVRLAAPLKSNCTEPASAASGREKATLTGLLVLALVAGVVKMGGWVVASEVTVRMADPLASAWASGLVTVIVCPPAVAAVVSRFNVSDVGLL